MQLCRRRIAAGARVFCSSKRAQGQKVDNVRNIGISAHIDSGKTTLSERILFYTGRIKTMHEVRGRDGVGATMDHMELEREKGITIQSAATYTQWKNYNINIIDTPGHVDFTIEVERALRVLDGAILVLCGVGGVQTQTFTVDRQMKRYNVPCIAFINKLDRGGANAYRVLAQMRSKLQHNAVFLQIPIGSDAEFSGVIDLIEMKAIYYEGDHGLDVVEREIPPDYVQKSKEQRHVLLEMLANIDDDIALKYLNDELVSVESIKRAIAAHTLTRKLTPVFVGSALKNKGVQTLLDSVIQYLPNPSQLEYKAFSNEESTESNKDEAVDYKDSKERKQVQLQPYYTENNSVYVDLNLPMIALAFKLEENRFGQLTYLRIYQGRIKRGDTIVNTHTSIKTRVQKLVQMHASQMIDVQEAHAGQICALFGVECASGETFTDGRVPYSIKSMFVPEPVISLSCRCERKDDLDKFSRAAARFMREDPTFRMHIDADSKETIISGMGELQLEIYRERLKREHDCPVITGQPKVAFRETIQVKANFEYTHKKQSGGAGQYAKVIGYIEPLEAYNMKNEFEDQTVGMNIPSGFIPAIQKGFEEACEKGCICSYPITGVRYVITDGQAHAVDSNELSFRLAARNSVKQGFDRAQALLLEPVMKLDVQVPESTQGLVAGLLSRRKGVLTNSQSSEHFAEFEAEVPLSMMFGFATELRSATQGKGEFAMEFLRHQPVPQALQQEMVRKYEAERLKKK